MRAATAVCGRDADPHGRRRAPSRWPTSRAGDAIYGTVRRGRYRRYVLTQVLAHWSTVKPAYRVTLEDGTELIASGDHRFLTDRGWKHVDGVRAGRAAAAAPDAQQQADRHGRVRRRSRRLADYRRGYLCGLIRGDGHLGSYPYERPAAALQRRAPLSARAHRPRGAAPRQGLPRRGSWMCHRRVRLPGGQRRARPMTAIRTAARDKVAAIARADRNGRATPNRDGARGSWPGSSTPRVATAAASGSHNTDPEIIDWTWSACGGSGFASSVEDRRLPNGLKNVRAARRAAARNCASSTRSIRRSRASATIEGIALKSPAPSSASRRSSRSDAASPLRHHHRHRRLHRQRRRQPQLLRPPHPHLPRLQRAAGTSSARSSSRSTRPRSPGRS